MDGHLDSMMRMMPMLMMIDGMGWYGIGWMDVCMATLIDDDAGYPDFFNVFFFSILISCLRRFFKRGERLRGREGRGGTCNAMHIKAISPFCFFLLALASKETHLYLSYCLGGIFLFLLWAWDKIWVMGLGQGMGMGYGNGNSLEKLGGRVIVVSSSGDLFVRKE